jgi:ribokinase
MITVDMTRIAVVGHVEWVDFIPVERFPVRGEILHAGASFARAAGGGGVVAVVLAELGAEVDFFCALGRDRLGELAARELEDRGVRVHAAWREQPTRRAVTLLDGGGERTIVTMGESLPQTGADELDWELLHGTDGVYFTAGDAGALERARWARVVVASPRGRSAFESAGPTIDALVFSAGDPSELEWATGIESRARLLVATEGAEGGHWWGESSGAWDSVEPPGEPQDTYGCGDSFAAGFTFGLASGASPGEAAAQGARSGAECLVRAGAP